MGCDARLEYGEFARSLHQRAQQDRVPIYGAIELTRRCNLNCVHCYCNLASIDRGARSGELPAAGWERILGEAAELGCLWLVVTGGEPLLHRDFRRILRAACSRGLLVTLFTNGVLITEPMADFLAEVAPFRVEITLYGATAATYEAVTGVPGSHDRAMAAIERLVARGVRVALKTMVLAQSRHELRAIEALARTGYGVPFRYDGIVTPRSDGSPAPLGSRLPAWRVAELDMLDGRKLASWREMGERFLGADGRAATLADGRLYTCGAGQVAFGVDPTGVMRVCSLAGNHGVDLGRCSLAEAWDRLGDLRRLPRDRESLCRLCVLRPLCDCCPVHAEMETGSPQGRVEYMCEIAHLRALVLGFEVPPHGPCEFCPGGSRREELERNAATVRRGTAAGSNPPG